MNDYAIPASPQRSSRVFRWLMAAALSLGPLSWLAHWSAGYSIGLQSCEPQSAPYSLLAGVEPEAILITFIAVVLATAGTLCAINAWRYLQFDTRADAYSAATPGRFLALCAVAGAVVFAIVMVFNAVGLALLPACA